MSPQRLERMFIFQDTLFIKTINFLVKSVNSGIFLDEAAKKKEPFRNKFR